MPDIPIVTLDVARFNTKRQEKLLKKLNSKAVQQGVNEILKDYINKYVPKKSGALRRSARATPDYISWGEGIAQYARYQYYGEIYGPNHPIIRGGRIVGWYSTPGVKKYPTGRELGKPGYWKGWRFGYTTPGTKHHWDEKFAVKYSRWRAAANREVTRYIKKECKKAGVKT